MNPVIKFFTYVPALRSYMKAVEEFNSRRFENAIELIDKSMKHPSFNNELVYQHYGQALCALGRFNEGHDYLVRACDMYAIAGWKLESPQELRLAEATLATLRQIMEKTKLEVNAEFLNRKLTLFDRNKHLAESQEPDGITVPE